MINNQQLSQPLLHQTPINKLDATVYQLIAANKTDCEHQLIIIFFYQEEQTSTAQTVKPEHSRSTKMANQPHDIAT